MTIVFFFSRVPFYPVDLVKSTVVNHYRETYEDNASQEIHKDWGWLYDSKSSAKEDYNSH